MFPVVAAASASLAGATLLARSRSGFALAAAFLNSVFGFCLGCEIFLLLTRRTHPEPNPQHHRLPDRRTKGMT